MATLKEMFQRRMQLEAQISIGELLLQTVYDINGLKEKYGDENVDAVLMRVEEMCLNPLREELERIDRTEVKHDKHKDEEKKKSKIRKKDKGARVTKTDKAVGAEAKERN